MILIDNYWHVANFSMFTWSGVFLWIVIWCAIDLIIKGELSSEGVFLNTISVLILSFILNFYTTYEFNKTAQFCQTQSSQGYHMLDGDCVKVDPNGVTVKIDAN